MKNQEKGFVLVTSLVLLAILTLAGVTSAYKTLVEIKVSKLSANLDEANMVAEMGLTQMYWYYSKDTQGKLDFKDLQKFMVNGGATPDAYNGTLVPESIDQAPADADINLTDFHIYTLTSLDVVDSYGWKSVDAGNNPQVAVWLTTFDDVAGVGYPYATPINRDVSSCPNGCRFVTYALGRSGEARSMMRESQSFKDLKLKGVSALTNAPKGDNYKALCGVSGGQADGTTSNAQAWSSNGKTDTVVLEVTQAQYTLGEAPSGIALASNTEVDKGNGMFGFRAGTSGATGVAFKKVPMILYSGHGSESAAEVDYADLAIDPTGGDLPVGELPKNLVSSGLMTSTDDKIDFFSDGNTNLFSIDHYRWAAEQLTCQNTAQNDGAYGNGIYCSKGERLRLALVAAGFDAQAPVTGRLSMAQFQWNVAKGIPMFGIVRLMLPAERVSSGVGCGAIHRFPNSNGSNYALMTAQGTYTNTYGTVDTDGNLGSLARMIVYGAVVIDYFADYNIEAAVNPPVVSTGNNIFNPEHGERILKPLEAVDVYFWADIPLLINPVLPRFAANHDPYAFPTAASAIAIAPDGATIMSLGAPGKVNMVSVADASSNAVNLASPYDGYFLWAEGMIPPGTPEGNAGTMRFMDRSDKADISTGKGLTNLANAMLAVEKYSSITANATDLLAMNTPYSNTEYEYSVIKYYYDLMVATANQTKANAWPIAPWPGNTFTSNFCMGFEDCGNVSSISGAPATNNMGDMLHLLFPSGYMHGWKVALAALDLKADDWNTILSAGDDPGIGETGGLYQQVSNGCSSDGTTAESPSLCNQGLPFNAADTGFTNLTVVKAIQDDESKYFQVTKDGATGYGVLDSEWADIASTIYSGGLIDIHSHTNMSGVMYTPGPLEWGAGIAYYEATGSGGNNNSSFNNNPQRHNSMATAMSYINGSIITGYGASVTYYNSNGSKTIDSRNILVFDGQSVDNVNMDNGNIRLRRYDWQRLK